jgi:hypothetical protein
MTDKQMTKDETIQTCCKLLAKLLYEQAKEANATEIKIRLNEITYKDIGFIGNVEVVWDFNRDNEFDEEDN